MGCLCGSDIFKNTISVRFSNQVNQVNQVNQSTPDKSAYRSEIDGLRAFAVLSVVAFHAFPNWLKGGFIGVDIFFVISGFLITSHIFENLAKGHFSLVDFFGRRILRIFPALILVMTSALVFGWFVLLADEYVQLGNHVASSSVFISNFVFASEVGYFDSDAELKPMLHLWSLAVEEQFYIFWPLTLWLAWKARFNLLLVSLVFLSASFSLNLIWVGRAPAETFFWPFGRFWELLVGSVLAWLMLYKVNVVESARSINNSFYQKFIGIIGISNSYGVTSFFGLCLLIGSVVIIDKADPFPSYTALFPVFGALLIIIGGSKNSFTKIVFSNRLAVWLGLISYPLYLWHWPILSYLHIIEDATPHRNGRIIAVFLAVFLAWITYQFVEKPIRFGRSNKTFRIVALVATVSIIGVIAFAISITDFKEMKSVKNVSLRKGLEHRIGSSSRWYEGTENWLFLGNSDNRTVEKLKLDIIPTNHQIDSLKNTFAEISDVASKSNTQVALLIGPNKSSVYKQRLPAEISVSESRYVNFFINKLSEVTSITVYDPTDDFINLSNDEGLLYYRTDTHWNNKGAFLAFNNLMSKLSFSVPNVSFTIEDSIEGDLIEISNLSDFPLMNDDTWVANIDYSYELIRTENTNFPISETFGKQETVLNSNPLVDKEVWVVGDSFTQALRPYFEATFREVQYLGHWNQVLPSLVSTFEGVSEKPDLIVVVRVERSF